MILAILGTILILFLLTRFPIITIIGTLLALFFYGAS